MGSRISEEHDAVVAFPMLSRAGINLGIHTSGNELTGISYINNHTPLKAPVSRIAKRTVRQLEHYFLNPENGFTLPLGLIGTPFQQRVWQAMLNVSPGSVCTYGALARQLKSSARAVGNACRRNPIPIVVPCHRVISSNGLGGYVGKVTGMEVQIKQHLLEHERTME